MAQDEGNASWNPAWRADSEPTKPTLQLSGPVDENKAETRNWPPELPSEERALTGWSDSENFLPHSSNEGPQDPPPAGLSQPYRVATGWDEGSSNVVSYEIPKSQFMPTSNASPSLPSTPQELHAEDGGGEDFPSKTGEQALDLLPPRIGIDRTNSFPEVPPRHYPSDSPSGFPPTVTQAQDILGSPSRDQAWPEQDNNSQFSPSASEQNNVPPRSGGYGHRYGPQDPVDQDLDMVLPGTSRSTPQESEARFEEGIPLMNEQETSSGAASNEAPSNQSLAEHGDIFGDLQSNEEDLFFANRSEREHILQPQHEPSSNGPPPPQRVRRKSTANVMESLHFAPKEVTHGSDQIGHQPDGMEGVTDTSISSLPDISEPAKASQLGHTGGDVSTEPFQESEAAGAPPQEQDLAAVWEAALGDDEILGDEEDLNQWPGTLASEEDFLQQDAPHSDEGLQHASHQFGAVNSATTPTYAVGSPVRSEYDASRDRNSAAGPSIQGRYTPSSMTPSHALTSASGNAEPTLANTALSSQSPNYMPQQIQRPGKLVASSSTPTGLSTLAQPQLSQPWHAQATGHQQRPDLVQTQSFADKSKGGYASPYDLPMDVSKPRKRPSMQQMSRGHQGQPLLPQAPPPRSTSMYAQDSATNPVQSLNAPSAGNRVDETFGSKPFHASQSSLEQPTQPQQVRSLKPKPSTSSFFEELPLRNASRPTSSAGRYAPHSGQPSPSGMTGPPPGQFAPPTSLMQLQASNSSAPSPSGMAAQTPGQPLSTADSMQRQASNSSASSAPHQLRHPDRVSPYAAPPRASSTALPSPLPSSRYSPAPPTQSSVPGHAKYAAQPSKTPPNVLPHLPRTSSPLAHHDKSDNNMQKPHSRFQNTIPASNHGGTEPKPFTEGPQSVPEIPVFPGQTQTKPDTEAFGQSSPNRPSATSVAHQSERPQTSDGRYAPAPKRFSPPQGTSRPPHLAKTTSNKYLPQSQNILPGAGSTFVPPRRSMTQSPSKVNPVSSTTQEPYQRPASVDAPTSPIKTSNPYSTMLGEAPPSRRRGLSQNLAYIIPDDGRELDPLARWKGCPIVYWGFGGSLVTTFPIEVQRYHSGQATPMIKCSPGEIKVRQVKDILPLPDSATTFPGPLKSKSKKKDVLAWLSRRIEIAENPTDERIILLKVLRLFVEREGILEGNREIEESTRSILCPELAGDENPISTLHLQGTSPGGNTKLVAAQSPAVSNSEAIDEIRRQLLKGDREKAIWYAVDKRQWSHAMLLSSTLSPEIWKQVIQEFVRQEVRKASTNTESLAVLYEVFAGNWEESIDELVRPSARAGFQFVSTSADHASSKNVLDGLDKWRQTLSLVLSNRSTDDGRALLSLGNLLLGYGRVDAAHICFLFGRAYSRFGGADEPQTNIALVGSNHSLRPSDFASDIDSILLSEVYEFGLSLSAPSLSSAAVPHLQAYKLHHAFILAEHGYRAEAQQYCEAISSSIKASTRPSTYYHGIFIATLDDLIKRLQHSPKDGSASWISKPSMEKVSGSIYAKFSSFIAGDEEDVASTGSGRDVGPEVGPFARVAGGTPTISRSPSNADIYGAYSLGDHQTLGGGRVSPGSAGRSSRYSPAGPYQPRSSQEQYRPLQEFRGSPVDPPRTSQDSGRPSRYDPQFSSLSPIGLPAAGSQPYFDVHHQPRQMSDLGPITQQAQPQSYEPASYAPITSENDGLGLGLQSSSGQPSQLQQFLPNGDHQKPASGYNPPAYEPLAPSGYEPPSHGGYDPPSPSKETGEDQSSPKKSRPKKSFMDNDNNVAFEAIRPSGSDKAQKDKEAEENFKRVAEADAKRAQQQGDKKGWFGGWFGKKDQAAGSGPIRAKLGEESSFYYDPDLKKWVNKKGGTTASTPSATPPPPKGPSIRSTSGGPPGMAPKASSALASAPPRTASSPDLQSQTLHPPSGPPSLPRSATSSGLNTPARAASPAGDASASVGHAPPSAPASTNGDGTPPTRPPMPMSNASSIDDLIGPPGQARKGGTVKKGKKGRGYVDVMAK